MMLVASMVVKVESFVEATNGDTSLFTQYYVVSRMISSGSKMIELISVSGCSIN